MLAVVVAAVPLYVFYKNVYPVPDYPLNLMPWIFLGLVALGMAWYTVLRLREPEIVEEVGTFEEQPVAPHAVEGRHATGTTPDDPLLGRR